MKIQKPGIKYQRQRQMLNDLSRNLICAAKTYRKLLQLASEIQEAILSDKVEYLLKVASQQGKLARKLQAHEKARMVLIEELATSLALPEETLSLSQLISLVNEPYATHYTTLRNELHSLISKLDTLSVQNARLLSSNIKYIDEMLEIFATLSKDSDSTYLRTGKTNNSQYQSILDYNL